MWRWATMSKVERCAEDGWTTKPLSSRPPRTGAALYLAIVVVTGLAVAMPSGRGGRFAEISPRPMPTLRRRPTPGLKAAGASGCANGARTEPAGAATTGRAAPHPKPNDSWGSLPRSPWRFWILGVGCPLWPWCYSGGRTTPTTGRQLGRPSSPLWAITGLPHRSKKHCYSRSIRLRAGGATLGLPVPSVLAVLRLIVTSTFEFC